MAKEKNRKLAKSQRVTLRDIAHEIGVSHVTVSRALRNSSEISAAMRERILRKAEKMGYEPDPMLSALAKYRLSTREKPVLASLAWLNTWRQPESMHQYREFDLYWQGARATAKRFGFNLEQFFLSEISMPRLEQILKSRSIRGVLIAPPYDPATAYAVADLSDFSWEDFSVVRLGRTQAYPAAHFVTSAQGSNTMLTLDVMRRKGYRRIGYVGFNRAMRIFLSGFTMGQHLSPEMERLSPLILEDSDPERKKLDQLRSWLSMEKPDAILMDIPYLPKMLNELGVRVPEDLALATVTIHDSPIDSGIDQEPEEIGRAAIRMLVALLTERNFGIPETRNEVLIQGSWVEGTMLPDRV